MPSEEQKIEWPKLS